MKSEGEKLRSFRCLLKRYPECASQGAPLSIPIQELTDDPQLCWACGEATEEVFQDSSFHQTDN